MAAGNLVDTIIIFRILRKLTTPWEKTDAFKTGLIDNKGKILVKKKDRTKEQKAAFTLLDRLVFNLKRLLAKVPGGSSQLATYIAALALIKEHVEAESNKETANALMEKLQDYEIIPIMEHDISTPEGYLDAMEEEIMREMTSGAAFGGSLSGAGTNADINATGLAGIDKPLGRKKKLKKILSRKL